LAGNARFQKEVFRPQRAHFRALARAQTPEALFIGCVDSRVPPELITMAEPGQMLVVRNVANLVPPPGVSESSVGAAVEFAVKVLRVPHIIVCGHTGCGGIATLVEAGGVLADETALGRWLAWARPILAQPPLGQRSDEDVLRYYVERNVELQLAHLAAYDCVAQAMAEGNLVLHGWVYDLNTGVVHVLDAHGQHLVPVSGPEA
jgi:carbonic anhydrase